MDYFRRSIMDFIDDGSDINAEKVYTFFSGLYRLSDDEDNPLVDMMDVMHSYEVGASRFTERHRDHYIHSINVFLLGVEVYENCTGFRNAYGSICGNGSFSTTDGSFLFVWGNAALFHDVGYPIEIASNQARMFIRQISNIGPGGRNTKVGIAIDSESDVRMLDLHMWGMGEVDVCDLLSEGINRNLRRDPVHVRDITTHYMERMFDGRYVDHGFFSSVMLLRTFAESLQRSGADRSRFCEEVITAASAIFMHNMYPYNLADDPRFGPLKIHEHPIGFLLMLCDGLQEWNRTSYGRYDSNVVYLKSSGIMVTEHMMRMNYIVDGEELDEGLGGSKESELRSFLDIGSIFFEGFRITCSIESRADILLRRIERGTFGNVPRPMLDSIEDIAKAIHEDYNRNRLLENPDSDLEYPTWEDLTQDLRYSNISQALDYVNKIEYLGYHIGRKGDIINDLSPDEVEVLSKMEHDRWVKERMSNGWVYGRVKDVRMRTSPYIAPWSDIPEDIREYDRQAVRNIIPILGRVGLYVLKRYPK